MCSFLITKRLNSNIPQYSSNQTGRLHEHRLVAQDANGSSFDGVVLANFHRPESTAESNCELGQSHPNFPNHADVAVVVDPPLQRGTPDHDNPFKALHDLGADYVRYVPWLPYPKLRVAELEGWICWVWNGLVRLVHPLRDCAEVENRRVPLDQAEGFLKTVRYVEAILKRLSPETKTTIEELGVIAADDLAQGQPGYVAKPIDNSYWGLPAQCTPIFSAS